MPVFKLAILRALTLRNKAPVHHENPDDVLTTLCTLLTNNAGPLGSWPFSTTFCQTVVVLNGICAIISCFFFIKM